MNKFGERLHRLRVETGETQEIAAAKIGVSGQAFSSYERGDREPQIDKLIEIARRYEVTVDFLVGNSFEKDASDVDAIPPEELSVSFDFLYDGSLDKVSLKCFWYAVRSWAYIVHGWNQEVNLKHTMPVHNLAGALDFMAISASIVGKILAHAGVLNLNAAKDDSSIAVDIKQIAKYLARVSAVELGYETLEKLLIEQDSNKDYVNDAWSNIEYIANNGR